MPDDDADRPRSPSAQELLDAVGIVSTPEGRQAAREHLAAARERMPPEKWALLRAQLGMSRPEDPQVDPVPVDLDAPDLVAALAADLPNKTKGILVRAALARQGATHLALIAAQREAHEQGRTAGTARQPTPNPHSPDLSERVTAIQIAETDPEKRLAACALASVDAHLAEMLAESPEVDLPAALRAVGLTDTAAVVAHWHHLHPQAEVPES
ncbi:MAG TPA: hypothetical protein VF657_25245 [Actinoplanes sp.]|jgi:hypothetical protein